MPLNPLDLHLSGDDHFSQAYSHCGIPKQCWIDKTTDSSILPYIGNAKWLRNLGKAHPRMADLSVRLLMIVSLAVKNKPTMSAKPQHARLYKTLIFDNGVCIWNDVRPVAASRIDFLEIAH